MAVSFISASAQFQVTGTSLTYAFDATNSDFLTVLTYDQTKTGISSVTYAGTSLTSVLNFATVDNNSQEFWVVKAPATGSNNVVITRDVSKTIISDAAAYSGIVQSNSVEATGTMTESGTGNQVANVSVLTANSWLLASHYSQLHAPDSLVNATLRTTGVTLAGNDHWISDSNGPLAVGNQTIGVHQALTDLGTNIAIDISPAGAAAVARFFTIMGVGT